MSFKVEKDHIKSLRRFEYSFVGDSFSKTSNAAPGACKVSEGSSKTNSIAKEHTPFTLAEGSVKSLSRSHENHAEHENE